MLVWSQQSSNLNTLKPGMIQIEEYTSKPTSTDDLWLVIQCVEQPKSSGPPLKTASIRTDAVLMAKSGHTKYS